MEMLVKEKKKSQEEKIVLSDDFKKYLKTYIPKRFHKTIIEAYYLLKKKGCTSVYLFGSLVEGRASKNSDIDIGICGLPGEKFIRTACELDNISDIEIDLIDFDFNVKFFNMLKKIDGVKLIE